MRPRAIFFGTPAFAVPSLEAASSLAEIVSVVTQPDRRAGRGLELVMPPVKARALELGFPVIQPTKVKTPELAQSLRDLSASVGIVVAYGRILPRSVLDAPTLGCLNVHASLLPRWRGAAPIAWAIAHGDRETGVCLMKMDEGMDTGPVLARATTEIGSDETAGELGERLARLGAGLLLDQLPAYLTGRLSEQPQRNADATMAPMLEKPHGRIVWSEPSRVVHDRVRAMSPWPGAFTSAGNEVLKVHRTLVVTEGGAAGEAGAVVAANASSATHDGALQIACGSGIVAILELQFPGRRRMTAREALSGRSWHPGQRLGMEFP